MVTWTHVPRTCFCAIRAWRVTQSHTVGVFVALMTLLFGSYACCCMGAMNSPDWKYCVGHRPILFTCVLVCETLCWVCAWNEVALLISTSTSQSWWATEIVWHYTFTFRSGVGTCCLSIGWLISFRDSSEHLFVVQIGIRWKMHSLKNEYMFLIRIAVPFEVDNVISVTTHARFFCLTSVQPTFRTSVLNGVFLDQKIRNNIRYTLASCDAQIVCALCSQITFSVCERRFYLCEPHNRIIHPKDFGEKWCNDVIIVYWK